jgi:tRNA A58 N-methylase Trm61
MSQTTAAAPNPGLVFETLNAYQRTAALRAAIELDLFTAIADGASGPSAIAHRIKADPRATRILCDFLVILGFLSKSGASYSLAPTAAAFLNRHSPAYLGTIASFLGAEPVIGSFRDLAATVRRGGALPDATTISPGNPVWVEFARTMAPLTTITAQIIAGLVGADSNRPMKVLDIAAGHGLFGITIAKQNPAAEIVAVDWPAVLDVAWENARAHGVEKRFSTIPGSAFDVNFRSGYDVILLTNFLHHFDAPTNERLLRRVHAALDPSGVVATLEFVPNDDRVTPPAAAAFSMIMLGTTPAGDAYTFKEFDAMFRNAGFSSNTIHPAPPTDESVILSRI